MIVESPVSEAAHFLPECAPFPLGAYAEPLAPVSLPAESAASGEALRVLHVINGEHYAGAERVQDLLAIASARYGVEADFACVKPQRFPNMRAAKAAACYEIAMHARVDVLPAFQLARLVKNNGYDVLHSHSARGAIVASLASWMTGAAWIHHVHGHTESEIGKRSLTHCSAWVERKLLQRASAIIAVSSSVGCYLHRHGAPLDRLFVVPNGVPVRERRSHPPSKQGGRTLGFVALLRERKGLETLLRAASQMLREIPNLQLRIVGRFETGSYERSIQRLTRQLDLCDRIEWRGFRRDVSAEFDAMDALAFPSVLPEGMPMVLLEAMASGLPIVASRVEGVTDVIQHQSNGLLVPPDDPAALAVAATSLLKNRALAESLANVGYCEQRARYSDDSMAQAMARIYRMVVMRNRKLP